MSLSHELSAGRGRYTRAADALKFLPQSRQLPSPAHSPEPLSDEDIFALCKPVVDMLGGITAYDIIGNSTQVVVVDCLSPLNVAFVAAQETKTSSCVLWSAKARAFNGMMTISDYIKILLAANENPTEAENYSKMTVLDWIAKRRIAVLPTMIVSSSVDDTLAVCLEKMHRHQVKRLLIISEKEEKDTFSVVSVMNHSHLVNYLAQAIFSESSAQQTEGALPAQVQSIFLGTSPPPESMVAPDDPVAPPEPVGSYTCVFDVPVCKFGPSFGKHQNSPVLVKMQTSVGDALRLLLDHNVDSVGVMDDRGILVDILARSDVMRLEVDGTYNLSRPVREALVFRVGAAICVYNDNDPLRNVLAHFSRSGVKTLFRVGHDDVVQGQLELTEVLHFLYQHGCSSSQNVVAEV